MHIYIKDLGTSWAQTLPHLGGKGKFMENAKLAENRLRGGTSLKTSRLLSLGKYVELTDGLIKEINVSSGSQLAWVYYHLGKTKHESQIV